MQTSYTIIYAASFLHFLYWYSKITSHMGVFLYSETTKEDPPSLKSKRKIKRRQIKLDLLMAHQGQCSGQVSLNLANLDFQGLTRFLSQGLLRWLETVSSTKILMGCYSHSLSLAATIMVSKNCPTIGEHVVVLFIT